MIRALGVQAISVDQGVLGRQAEYSSSRVTGLRQRCCSTYFNDSRSKFEQGRGYFSILIQAARDTDRVAESIPKDLHNTHNQSDS